MKLEPGGRVVEVGIVPVSWEGRPAHLVTALDVSAQAALEEKVRRLEAEKALILESVHEAVVCLDRDFRVVWANRRAALAAEVSPEELIGAKCYEVWRRRGVSCPACPVAEALSSGRPAEGEIYLETGRVWSVRAVPVKDEEGNVTGAIEAVLGITKQKKFEEKARYLSIHDPLTGLYNRAFFEEELKRLEAERRRPVAVLVADLDGVKLINDSFGYAAGDRLLKAAAQILSSLFGKEALVCRLGGDEFAVLLVGADEEAAAEAAGRVLAKVEEEYSLRPDLPVQLSVGYAAAVGAEDSLKEALRRADDLMYRQKLVRGNGARSRILRVLLAVLNEKDFVTAGHVRRVEKWCLAVGKKMGLSASELADLALLSRAHDIGKVGIPDAVLFKPGPLSPEEWEIMKAHSEKGYRIALSLPELSGIAGLILKHHERWDGTGYPLGLKGEMIPLQCRILAVADAFDAMTSPRPYRNPVSATQALEELKRCAESQFDPNVVKFFVSLFSELK